LLVLGFELTDALMLGGQGLAYSRLTELFGIGQCQPVPHSRLAQSHVPAHLADIEPLDADHQNDLQLEAGVKDSSS
jgi:hypothetical protein